jgi:predicted RNA binding protein YcfA (HicA-like mRNA interferase family)
MVRGNVTVIIPNRHAGDITPGFLRRLLRQAGVTSSEWLGEG